MNKSVKEEHPSYGMISFGRINGRPTGFYGSEIVPDNYIEMRIYSAYTEKSLTDEKYYAKNMLARVRITPNQFSELITSMNIGDGVPCTIERLPDGRVEEFQATENRKEFIHNTFKERMVEYRQQLKEYEDRITELTKKKTLSKADIEEVRIATRTMTQEIDSNIPFFMRCFQETMDNIVVESKTAVESAILHKIHVAGLEQLHKENNLLRGPEGQ